MRYLYRFSIVDSDSMVKSSV